jgi:hypothetical protein
MKPNFYFAVAILLLLFSCADDQLSSPAKNQSASPVELKVHSTAAVTGLTQFRAAKLAIPSGGLTDGKRFYADLSLRANVAYYPYSIMSELRNGTSKVRFYVKPTQPTTYLLGTQYPYHHRAEFTRYPWKICLPLGTEEWLGFSYIFPTASEGFTQNQTPVSIYQNHAGRIDGQTENPPAFYIEIAYPGQLKSYSDPNYNTPLGGEIMIINNVRGIRWVVPGVRVTAGARINFIIQIVYGLGNAGLLNVWINGNLATFQGNGKVAAGNAGSTVWPPVLSTDVAVGGNSKLGLYHHQLRFEQYVTLNASKGHTHMRMWMTDWNDVFRKPTDWDYKNINAYGAVDTSGYP